VIMSTDSWFADLPELDDRGRELVLRLLLDVLTYRDLTRDDYRELVATAASWCWTPISSERSKR
jgi:hypothetical protein